MCQRTNGFRSSLSQRRMKDTRCSGVAPARALGMLHRPRQAHGANRGACDMDLEMWMWQSLNWCRNAESVSLRLPTRWSLR